MRVRRLDGDVLRDVIEEPLGWLGSESFFGTARSSAASGRRERLEGQRAVKAAPATGGGKPLRTSTPWTDLARNKARRAKAE
jgi:hypothetical protein